MHSHRPLSHVVAERRPAQAPRSVPVSVMDIGVVRVGVGEGGVAVLVWMGLLPVPGEVVGMLVMRVVLMAVHVDERLMSVLVFVPLGEVQPDPGRHQHRGHPEGWRRRFVKHGDGDRSADKRRHREIGTCASCAQLAQGENE